MKELAAGPATSPRLRGEVLICACVRIPGEGQRRVSQLCNFRKAPHPDPLPANGARENSGASAVGAARMRGRRIANSVNSRTWLSTVIVPPCCCTTMS